MAITLTSRATVYDRYAISRKFTAQETAINVVQGSINLFASESEITELKNGDKTMYSKLSSVEIDLKSIILAVSSSEYQDINGVLSAITQARASITLNTQQIELKVSKDSIVSTINQSAEAIKIDANKIALTGNGIIDILNTGTTTISAARISLEGLTTINGNFKVLTDGSMEAKNGRFSGNITGGSAYLDAKYLSAGSDNVQLMIAGTGPVDRCVLSDSTLQFTNGSFFGIDSNMIMIKLERESGIKNQVRINNNVNGHPAMMLYENGVLKTSVSGYGIMSNNFYFDSDTGTTAIRKSLNNVYVGNTQSNLRLEGISCYANGGIIQTSDKYKKKDIVSISAAYEQFVQNLRPVLYKFNDGTSGRAHAGFIAQDVKQALFNSGLDTADFAGYAEYADPETGEMTCGLRYDEFTSLNTMMIQKCMEKIQTLEQEILQLKAQQQI